MTGQIFLAPLSPLFLIAYLLSSVCIVLAQGKHHAEVDNNSYDVQRGGLWDALVNISRSESKQSEVLRTDNQQSFSPISNKMQDFILSYILNPFICVHHCHNRRDLGEERYRLRQTFFAPYSRKRDQIAILCWFFTFRTVSNCDRGKPRARNNKLCHVFYSNNQFACTACYAWTTKYVSKAIGLRLERMKRKET